MFHLKCFTLLVFNNFRSIRTRCGALLRLCLLGCARHALVGKHHRKKDAARVWFGAPCPRPPYPPSPSLPSVAARWGVFSPLLGDLINYGRGGAARLCVRRGPRGLSAPPLRSRSPSLAPPRPSAHAPAPHTLIS